MIDVFMRGTDGALWSMISSDGGITWSNWTSLGGQIPVGTGPAACSWGAGRLDVFVQGTDGALWHRMVPWWLVVQLGIPRREADLDTRCYGYDVW